MPNSTKISFLSELEARFGTLSKLPNSQSLFQLRGREVRLYIRYSKVQTLLGGIGVANGHDVWIPAYDRAKLGWAWTQHYESRIAPPIGFKGVDHIVAEIDVLWLNRGTNEPTAVFEVEHSTTIYSGL